MWLLYSSDREASDPTIVVKVGHNALGVMLGNYKFGYTDVSSSQQHLNRSINQSVIFSGSTA
jgi:hypothetical protein